MDTLQAWGGGRRGGLGLASGVSSTVGAASVLPRELISGASAAVQHSKDTARERCHLPSPQCFPLSPPCCRMSTLGPRGRER